MPADRADGALALSFDIETIEILRWRRKRALATAVRHPRHVDSLLLVGTLLSILALLLSGCGSRTLKSHPDEYAGVGVVLHAELGGPVIGKVMEDGPADDAGLREGDRVVSVDGEYVGDLSLAAVVDMLRGRVGTQVILGVENVTGRSEVVVTRAKLARADGKYQRQ